MRPESVKDNFSQTDFLYLNYSPLDKEPFGTFPKGLLSGSRAGDFLLEWQKNGKSTTR